jgi:hypothetical protein
MAIQCVLQAYIPISPTPFTVLNNTGLRMEIQKLLGFTSSKSTGNEMERMWKETVMTQFEALSQHLPGGIEENYEISYYSSQSCDLNQDLQNKKQECYPLDKNVRSTLYATMSLPKYFNATLQLPFPLLLISFSLSVACNILHQYNTNISADTYK